MIYLSEWQVLSLLHPALLLKINGQVNNIFSFRVFLFKAIINFAPYFN